MGFPVEPETPRTGVYYSAVLDHLLVVESVVWFLEIEAWYKPRQRWARRLVASVLNEYDFKWIGEF